MSLVKVAALFETSLQAKINPAATTMTLVNGTDKDGNTLSGLYGLVIDEGSANEEFVIGTVAGTSVTSMIRDIDVSNPDVAGTGKDHRRGASVKITDYPFLGQLAKLFTSGGTIESLITFLNTARPKLDSDVDTLNDTEFVTKGELSRTALGALTNNRLVEAGNAGATISAGNLIYLDVADSKWKLADATNPAKCQNVQLGIAQGAGTDGNPISGGVLRRGLDNHQTGLSTGAYYVSNTPGAISSAPGTYEVTIGSYFSATELYFDTRFNQQITEDEQDALAGTSGTPSATNKYVTNDDTAENTASKLVRRKSDGTIDGAINIFGDGSDGDVTTSGNVTLTRDMFYNTLTVAAGHTVNPNGFRIYVKDTLTIAATALIDRTGNAGGAGNTGVAGASDVGGTAGAALNTNTVFGSAIGAVGGIGENGNAGDQTAGANGTAATFCLVTNVTDCSGGAGGATVGNGGAGGSKGSVTVSTSLPKSLINILTFQDPTSFTAPWYKVNSSNGAGGGGRGNSIGPSYGGSGGGSGSNGGVIWIAANTLINNGTIRSKGGAGGAGGAGGNSFGCGGGGGAGGSGGLIFIVYSAGLTIGTTDITGGAGGAGGAAGGGSGAAGYAGTTGLDGLVQTIQI